MGKESNGREHRVLTIGEKEDSKASTQHLFTHCFFFKRWGGGWGERGDSLALCA